MIHWAVGLIGSIGLLYWLWQAWPLVVTMLQPRRLSDVRLPSQLAYPTASIVSVIVPARNEAAAIRQCLASLLAQEYPNLEVIAVDDRSTDETGRIMDELAAGDSRLTVLHVGELPPSWLGKNHANWLGARQARGAWLLFTDGDVLFEPDAIARAVFHAQAEGLYHLSLFPGLICDSSLEKAVVCFFGLLLCVALNVRNVRNPLKPWAFCGVGAFNLVRADAYRAVGTHERLRMEVADDIKLGKLLKRAGFITDLLEGGPKVSLRWQTSFWGIVRGLEKNGFAGSEYRLARSLSGALLVILLCILPPVGTVFAPGWLRGVYAAWMLSEMAVLALAARRQRFGWTVGLAFPVAGVTVAYAIARSTLLAVRRGGISWRETFYSLEELRRGTV